MDFWELFCRRSLSLSLSRIYSTMKQQKESKNEPIIKEKVHKLIDEPVRRKF